ncbi:MAG: RNA 2',3'-cyclic phosphodiesterase [Alphaproteobacteria bacterium]
MPRLFVGLDMPPYVSERIHLLSGGIPGARWTKVENYHVTLTFIGDVSEAQVDDIDEALAGIDCPAFDLEISGTGSFAQGDDPKVLWLGIAENPALKLLKQRVDSALDHYGIPFERRSRFTPHITLARFRQHPEEDKIGAFMQTHNLFKLPPLAIEDFVLYESYSGSDGPVYQPMEYYPLGS